MARIQSLAQELPYAMSAAIKTKKEKKKKKVLWGRTFQAKGTASAKALGQDSKREFTTKRVDRQSRAERASGKVRRSEAGERGWVWKTMARTWSLPCIAWKPVEGSVLLFETGQ